MIGVSSDETKASDVLACVHVAVDADDAVTLAQAEVHIGVLCIIALEASDLLVKSVHQLDSLHVVAVPSLHFYGGNRALCQTVFGFGNELHGLVRLLASEQW